MSKFVSVIVGDVLWLAVEYGTKRIMLHPQCRVGDCYRPGQRMRSGR